MFCPTETEAAGKALRGPGGSAGLWAVAALVYGLLVCLCALTPYMADDYVFSRGTAQAFSEIMAGAPVLPQGKITLAEVFHRSCQMYFTWDGRFASYLPYSFFFWLPAVCHVLFAPLLALAAIWGILLHVFGPCWRQIGARHLLAVSLLFFVSLPSFGAVYFWRTGLGIAVSICFTLFFLLPYRMGLEGQGAWAEPRKNGQVEHGPGLSCVPPDTGPGAPSVPACLAFGLFALFTGLLEYLTPILCALLSWAACWYFWQKSKKSGRPDPRLRLYLAGAAGMALACLLIFLAPGNALRVLSRSPEFLQWDLWEKISAFLLRQPKVQAQSFLPYLLLAWSLWVLGLRQGQGRRFWQAVPLVSLLFFAAAFVGQGAYIFAPEPPARSYATLAVFVLTAACAACRAALKEGTALAVSTCPQERTRWQRARCMGRAGCALLLLFVFFLVPQEILLFQKIHTATQQRDALYARSTGKAICVPPLPARGDDYMVLGRHVQDLGYNPDFWINRAVAAAWKLQSVALCPRPERFLEWEQEAARSNGPSGTAEPGLALTARQHSDVLDVRLREARPQAKADRIQELLFYYYGNPALLSLLPQGLGDAVSHWLSAGPHSSGASRLKAYLVPLFYAQARARLTWSEQEPAEGLGQAKFWGVYPGAATPYLVCPGRPFWAFDLLPLRERAKPATGVSP